MCCFFRYIFLQGFFLLPFSFDFLSINMFSVSTPILLSLFSLISFSILFFPSFFFGLVVTLYPHPLHLSYTKPRPPPLSRCNMYLNGPLYIYLNGTISRTTMIRLFYNPKIFSFSPFFMILMRCFFQLAINYIDRLNV